MWVVRSPKKPPRQKPVGTYAQPRGRPHDWEWSPIRGKWKKWVDAVLSPKKSPQKSAASAGEDVAPTNEGPTLGEEEEVQMRGADKLAADLRVGQIRDELVQHLEKQKQKWMQEKEMSLPPVCCCSHSLIYIHMHTCLLCSDIYMLTSLVSAPRVSSSCLLLVSAAPRVSLLVFLSSCLLLVSLSRVCRRPRNTSCSR